MNAQVQPNRSIESNSLPRSSARVHSTARANAEARPTLAEDRSISTKPAQRVDPLWMISGAAALLFAFLAAVVAFS